MRNQVGALSFVGSFPKDWPEFSMPEIAFAGRSNVGKSSALNCLLNSRKAARVSQRPGRTQAINLFKVGTGCVFADLPGYGFAKVPESVQKQWKGMVEGYLATRADLCLVVVLIDARRAPQKMDGELIYGLIEAGIPALVVATKVDKLKRRERSKNLKRIREDFRLPAGQPVPFSAVTKEGRDTVWDQIESAAGVRS
jgi:GTP-binding protein